MYSQLKNDRKFTMLSVCICNYRICLKMNVLSTDMNATEADVVAAVKKELESKPHPGLEIGYVGDFFSTGRCPCT